MFNDASLAVSEDQILKGLEKDITAAKEALEIYIKERSDIDSKFQKIKAEVANLRCQIKDVVGEAQNHLKGKMELLLSELTEDQKLQIKIEDVKAAIVSAEISDMLRTDLVEHVLNLNVELLDAQKPRLAIEQEIISNIIACKNRRVMHIAKKHVALTKWQFIEKFNEMHDVWQSLNSDIDFSSEIEDFFRPFIRYYDDAAHVKFVKDFVSKALEIVQQHLDNYNHAVENAITNIGEEGLHDATDIEINAATFKKMELLFFQLEEQVNQKCVATCYDLKRLAMREIAAKYMQDKIAMCNICLSEIYKHLAKLHFSNSDLKSVRQVQNEIEYFSRLKKIYEDLANIQLENFDVAYEDLEACEKLLYEIYKSKESSYLNCIGLESLISTAQIMEDKNLAEIAWKNKNLAKLALEICRLEVKQLENMFVQKFNLLKSQYGARSTATASTDGLAKKIESFANRIFGVQLSYVEKIKILQENITSMLRAKQDQNIVEPLSRDQITEGLVEKIAEVGYLQSLKKYYFLYMKIAANPSEFINPVTASEMILLPLQIYLHYFKTTSISRNIEDKTMVLELSAALYDYKKFHNQLCISSTSGDSTGINTPSLALLLQIRRIAEMSSAQPPIMPNFFVDLNKLIAEVMSNTMQVYSDDSDTEGEHDEDNDSTYDTDESSTPRLPLPATPEECDAVDLQGMSFSP